MDILNRISRQAASLEVAVDYFGDAAAKEILDEAVGLIADSTCVCLSGMGGSRYGLMPAATFLRSRGQVAFVEDAAEQLHYGTLPRGAAAILMSRSGRTVEIVKLSAKLRSEGVSVIALTNCPNSPLGENAHVTLPIPGDLDEGVSIQTYTAGVLAGLYLAGSSVDAYDEVHEGAIELSRRMPNLIMKSGTDAEGWPLGGVSHICLLGRGYSIASAAEGCLLFHELGRRPACWYGAAEFGQGPVEVLTSEHAVIIFAPRGATSALNEALASDLRRT
jgi:glucosamine--fructose-6-phosphate aminotransferase (isomerizing)